MSEIARALPARCRKEKPRDGHVGDDAVDDKGNAGRDDGAKTAEVAVSAAATSSSYPAFTIVGMRTPPMATAVATADPVMAAKIALAKIVASPRPPRMWPRRSRAKLANSSVMPDSLIRLPASMKSGMARRENEAMPAKVVCTICVKKPSGMK